MCLQQGYVGGLDLVPISTLYLHAILATSFSLSVSQFPIYKAAVMYFSFYCFSFSFLYFSPSGDRLSFPYYVENVATKKRKQWKYNQ